MIEEWTTLETTLGGSSVAGGKMKEAGSGVPFNWQSPNTAADNSSGWAGLPGGYRVTNGFFDVGFYGNWWSIYRRAVLRPLALQPALRQWQNLQGLTSILGQNGNFCSCLRD
ncbi:MAG: hypothetical protein IPG79_10540 [Saprospiraceae bacterium]|nr:hypothetical protein [Saprospiraceae bacterium]